MQIFCKLNSKKGCYNTLIHLLAQVLILRAPFGGQGADSRIFGIKQYYYFSKKSGMSLII